MGGATIQRTSGFNAKYIYDNNIGPGAIIKLVRSGDVIPYIEGIVKSSTNMEDLIECPTCKCTPLESDETLTHLYCTNKECSAQTQKGISHFFEKLGLENFSEKMLTSLGCKTVIDVYNLKKEDILKLDGWAETSTVDFLNRIEQTKKARPEKILAALGIDNLGNTTSKLILEHFTPQDILNALDNQDLLKVLVTKLIQIKGLGEIKVKSVIKGLIDNKELLKKLMDTGINFVTVKGPLTGKSFCITGSLSKPRKAYEQIIEKFGGSNTSISSCNYLICNTPSESSKFQKAKDKGVKIINETELISLIRESKK